MEWVWMSLSRLRGLFDRRRRRAVPKNSSRRNSSPSPDTRPSSGQSLRHIKVRICHQPRRRLIRRFSLDTLYLSPRLLQGALDITNELLNIGWSLRRDLLVGSITTLAMVLVLFNSLHEPTQEPLPPPPQAAWEPPPPPPLVMTGGNPYIRALMRTISASESNVEYPYSVLYGGQYVRDIKHHPDKCVTIVVGPNKGNCTTAAGRYQMLTDTWAIKSELYHPQPPDSGDPKLYNFEAKYQDRVVYEWLSDSKAWGNVDLADLLRQGRLTDVLRILSSTWTSLGYGIETNSMSQYLPQIYEQMLAQECSVPGSGCPVLGVDAPTPAQQVRQ